MSLAIIAKSAIDTTRRTLVKHAPELLMGAGIVGAIGSTVLACKATLKLDEILDEHKAETDRLKEGRENVEEYTEKAFKSDMAQTYIQTGVRIAKLYAPSVALGVTSFAAIVGSHRILSTRCASLAATLTATFDDFKAYRKRVIDDLGVDADRKYRFGMREEEVATTIMNEDGTEETVVDKITLLDNNKYSPFAKFFDEGCREWTKDPEYNMSTLIMRQNCCNDQLRAKGYMFLNDVYDMLGIPRTQAGQIYGWIYDPDCPNGDNYIDFNIYNTTVANRNFVNGYEPVILLDFNVDGPIIDLI